VVIMQGYNNAVIKKEIDWASLMEEADESHIEHIKWYCRMHELMNRDPKTGLRYFR